jgi:hypothetical protein
LEAPEPRAYTCGSMAATRAAAKHKVAKKTHAAKRPAEASLKGWTTIASFLAIPVSTAHRWARDGMPVRREGRSTVADPDQLRAWLGRESHMSAPAQIVTDQSDVAGALKESIAAVRRSAKKP